MKIQISDKRVLAKIQQVIIQATEASTLADIDDVQAMSGFMNYYRIKFDYRYRIGVYVENQLIQFLRVDNREGFYKKFP